MKRRLHNLILTASSDQWMEPLWNTAKELSYTSLRMGGVTSIYLGPRIVYVLTDPDDYLTVANACLQKDNFYNFAKPWLGEGLVTGTLPIWRHHRKLLNPAFSQLVLDGFQGVFNSQSRRLVRDMASEAGKGPFDHWAYTRRNALETICLTALGVDFCENSVLNSQYEHAAEQMFNVLVERFQKVWLHSDFLYNWSSLKKKQERCLEILHNMSNTVLRTRKASYLSNKKNGLEASTGTKFKTFLDLLLELSIEKGAFNDLEIREQVDTMIVAGHDTSANVLMFTLVMIGSYPKVQERIFEELYDIFGNDDRDVTKQDLSQLVYLEAVLKETMRVYPIVPVTARWLDRNVKLKNYTLTAGRTCLMFVYGVHRHAMWGPDAEEFKPERWLDPATLPHCPNAFAAFNMGRRICIENYTLTAGRTCLMFVYGVHRHAMWGPDAEEFKPERWLEPATLPHCPNAFAAFNMGRRICIGKTYAYSSMKTTLAHLLRHYRVQADHNKMILKLDVMLKPEYGHLISIEKR
ncbi:Cytochrome P450 4C1 [Papilio xuthus]|uniref:Cytochrome P450 4C1 n=1 Tax=Papilio xuthus TaxID=66420 RepID=A0A194QJJ0_PAPXU|nr:Cytochrome P450 4C1 [Papilio xuthus]